jgi:putative DNA primase/helicase
MAKDKKPVPDQVRELIADAERQAALLAAGPAPRDDGDDGLAGFDDEGEPGTVPGLGHEFDPAVVMECAGLDHSDTDNARRLLAHFGEDLLVLAQAKAKAPLFAVWDGRRWDMETGGPRATAIAQKLGGAIALEAGVLKMTESEQRLIERAKGAAEKDPVDLTATERTLIAKAEKAAEAYRKRVQRRMAHAVTSKNKGRIEAGLAMLAPHVMVPPDGFNADPLKIACAGHTLAFRRAVRKVRNPDYDDPDIGREDVPEFVERVDAACTAIEGHSRADRITQIMPVRYDAQATCPRFMAWLNEFQPVVPVRRMLQVATGLGLLGLTVQRLFFHYGKGSNGKSVYMETMVRLLGDVAVTLPSETFAGEGGAKPGAQPDLVRLYGRRFLRVQELPQGEPLREELVKKLTGGEDVPVRDLFQGYFDFKPIFTGHMSGNGYPEIKGTDNGIWRRMVVVHWPKTIPTDQQREFEEVLAEFEPEYPGILNWLIEGALIFLREGLVVPAEALAATTAYRDEMDRTSAFCRDCVRHAPGQKVQARTLYEAYVNWAVDRAERAISETRFAKNMAAKYTREDGRTRQYLDIMLQDVPPAKSAGDRPPPATEDDYR